MEPGTFNSQFLTPARLRWVLDVGESTEAAWREARLISFFKQGDRLVRYDPAAVLEFIGRHTIKARSLRTATAAGAATFGDADWGRIERLLADQVRAARANVECEPHGQIRKAA